MANGAVDETPQPKTMEEQTHVFGEGMCEPH